MSARWPAWVKTLNDLTPSQRLTLTEIATLVDTRGVALVLIRDLCAVTGLSMSTTHRALNQLQTKHYLHKTRTRTKDGHLSALRVQLLQTPTKRHPNPKQKPETSPTHDLAAMLRAAIASDWTGPASVSLAKTLTEQTRARLSWACDAAGLDPEEAISIGWLTARAHATKIMTATKPWAYWATICARELHKLAQDHATTNTDTSVTIGVDDFTPEIQPFIDALQDAGLSPTCAHAATARALELATTNHGRQLATALKTDARLKANGLTPQHTDLLISRFAQLTLTR